MNSDPPPNNRIATPAVLYSPIHVDMVFMIPKVVDHIHRTVFPKLTPHDQALVDHTLPLLDRGRYNNAITFGTAGMVALIGGKYFQLHRLSWRTVGLICFFALPAIPASVVWRHHYQHGKFLDQLEDRYRVSVALMDVVCRGLPSQFTGKTSWTGYIVPADPTQPVRTGGMRHPFERVPEKSGGPRSVLDQLPSTNWASARESSPEWYSNIESPLPNPPPPTDSSSAPEPAPTGYPASESPSLSTPHPFPPISSLRPPLPQQDLDDDLNEEAEDSVPLAVTTEPAQERGAHAPVGSRWNEIRKAASQGISPPSRDDSSAPRTPAVASDEKSHFQIMLERERKLAEKGTQRDDAQRR
ncbi:hypothetical protein FISHEDRAFT_57310 [Fistulina hepatica ATCC 64428]|uniref:Uncharacterized protein n=1 Tax=Fistulina hepatica ATCC 64428 TaxID=1128425 RepID=A0A0D7AGQ3_9AGAR|nr:hypothetical protein FISHEDRAFT_57310 [Fistulina hepatica ATCC 64428]